MIWKEDIGTCIVFFVFFLCHVLSFLFPPAVLTSGCCVWHAPPSACGFSPSPAGSATASAAASGKNSTSATCTGSGTNCYLCTDLHFTLKRHVLLKQNMLTNTSERREPVISSSSVLYQLERRSLYIL